MIEILGNNLTFVAFFTIAATKVGATGLTLTVDVRRGNTTLLSDQAATELGGGLYSYTLSSAQTGTAGAYSAVFKATADTVDVKHVPAMWMLGTDLAETMQDVYDLLRGPGATQYAIRVNDGDGNPLPDVAVWITNSSSPTAVIGGLWTTNDGGLVNGSNGVYLDADVTYYIWCLKAGYSFVNPDAWVAGEGASPHVIAGAVATSGLTPDFDDLRTMLRARLNDYDDGNYSDTDIDQFLNHAYRETTVAARCYKIRKSVALLTGTHTYHLDNVFEPIEVSVSGDILDRNDIGDLGVSLETWDSTASGTPTKWMHMRGSYIRVHPTPSANGTMIVYGYAHDADMTLATDQPTVLPVGYAVPVILDRAEAEARRARSTHANNAQLVPALMGQWDVWVNAIKNSLKGKG